MKYKNYLKTIFAFFSFVTIMSACQKNGELQPELSYYQIYIKWFYTPNGDVPYKVEIDGLKVTDSLIFSKTEYNLANKLVTDNGKKLKHLVISDADKDSIVLDTMIHINGKRTVQLLAVSPEDRPVIMDGGNNEEGEADPDSTAAKYRYYYSEPLLPDSISMEFYYCNATTRPFVLDLPSAHTLTVRKGEFSDYLELDMSKYGNNTFILFDLKDAKTDTLIQQVVVQRQIAISTGFSEAYSKNRNAGNDLSLHKFVTAILRYGGPDEATARRNRFHDLFLFGTPW